MPAFPDDLTEHEEALIEAVSRGEAWFGMPSPPSPKQLTRRSFVATMPKIRATVIRALCVGARNGGATIDPYGIQIVGARIIGELDISFFNLSFQLSLENCYISDQLNLFQLKLPCLDLSGSRIINPIMAEGIKIEGDLICRTGFRSDSGFHLVGAQIEGDVVFSGARLSTKKGDALAADGITIGGSLFCRDGFTINGNADFTTANVRKWFHWRPEKWSGKLYLSHAHAGQWRDDWTVDYAKGEKAYVIDITTFHYDALAVGNEDGNTAESRIDWIRKSSLSRNGFFSGPYETLAKALRANGDDVGANQVGYAKATDRAKHRRRQLGTKSGTLTQWLWKLADRAFDLTVGYGYKPLRGVGWLAGFLVLGFVIFLGGSPLPPNGIGLGLIKPSEPIIFSAALKRRQSWPGPIESAPLGNDVTLNNHFVHYTLPPEYTPFSPFWYSLDTLIPLVDLGQEGAWAPSPIDTSFWKDPGGWIVLIYLYVHILAGWVLSTLTVVALTGVIKKD